jgi:hypothetical protein
MNYSQYFEQPYKAIDLYSQAMAIHLDETIKVANLGDHFWDNCQHILELGAGQGIIALALYHLVEQSCQISTLDIEVPLHPQVITEIGSQLDAHLGETISEFLNNYPHAIFDLITLVNVGSNHGINHSEQLVKVMKPGGVVLDCMTGLSEKIMKPRFKLLTAKQNNLWILSK